VRQRDEPVRLTRIYTRGGDAGETSLGDGSRVPKLDCRIGAFGTVDEVNSHLGVALADPGLPDAFRAPLERIQNELFDVGADLSVPYGVGDGRLRIDTCDERCPPAYRLRVEIQSPNAPDLAVSGGGSIMAQAGFRAQPHFAAAVNGGGHVDARALDAASVSAAVNGGGEVLVHARASLAGAVNGGGHIRYWGSPAVTSAVHGGGSISPGA